MQSTFPQIVSKLKILGLLPARGGSKGIPGKNLRLLHGQPLMSWAALALSSCTYIDRCICSTDDLSIAKTARQFNLDTPFIRPLELSKDNTPIVDVVRHALEELDDPENPYTHVALVQATTPTVTTEDITRAIDLMIEYNADTIITGFLATSQHPVLMFTKDPVDGHVNWLLPSGYHANRRQDFPLVFVRTGLLYLVSANVIRTDGSLYGDCIHAMIVDENKAVTIDEEQDFQRAEELMGKLNEKNTR